MEEHKKIRRFRCPADTNAEDHRGHTAFDIVLDTWRPNIVDPAEKCPCGEKLVELVLGERELWEQQLATITMVEAQELKLDMIIPVDISVFGKVVDVQEVELPGGAKALISYVCNGVKHEKFVPLNQIIPVITYTKRRL